MVRQAHHEPVNLKLSHLNLVAENLTINSLIENLINLSFKLGRLYNDTLIS